jgi:hypothetical protein
MICWPTSGRNDEPTISRCVMADKAWERVDFDQMSALSLDQDGSPHVIAGSNPVRPPPEYPTLSLPHDSPAFGGSDRLISRPDLSFPSHWKCLEYKIPYGERRDGTTEPPRPGTTTVMILRPSKIAAIMINMSDNVQ